MKSAKGRWYIKLGESIQGPFPNKLIGRYLILGRIKLETLVSQDKNNWAPVKNYPAMVPDVVREAGTPEGDRALMLARIREDERSSRERSDAMEGEDERREDEEQIMRLHRQMRDDVLKYYNQGPRQKVVYYTIAAALLFTLIGFFIASQTEDTVRLADCSATPQPGINWSGCNKQGERLRNQNLDGANLRSARLQNSDFSAASLRHADLAYADLSQSILISARLQQSNLVGANLRRANLRDANLKGADLSYAELEGAQLQGANLKQTTLDHAIWVNGKTCLSGSVGGCLLPVEGH